MLQLQDVHKSYTGQPLLRGLSFEIARCETACLLGPSGSGKSTVLQLIAGLDSPETGRVLWDGRDLGSTPTHRRDFGLVFQDYALFPHLDVLSNVAFGLRMKRASRAETARRVAKVLQLVNLEGFEHRSVTNLSGGEQQRVALARALAPRPRLLMFDEPLAALDRGLREELLDELRRILARTRIPALYVTHDQEEAFKIADRILLLHHGRIVQAGSPADVWTRPASAWVAGFLGLGNILSGEIIDKKPRIRTSYGLFSLRCSHKHGVGDAVHVLARPTRVRAGATLGGVVRDVVFQQDGYRVTLSNGLFFDATRVPSVGSSVTVRLQLECLGLDQTA
jgi:ABC-type Fe3+/spermidine/putrescine transport system ATPase subunit